MDLRTRQGRAFKAVYARLIAQYGNDHEAQVIELAGLKLTIEATRADTLSSDKYAAVQARRTLVPLVRLAEQLEAKLAETKPTVEPEKPPKNLAAWLAKREGK